MRGCVITGVWGAGKTSVYQRTIAQLLNSGCESLIAMPQAATLTTHTYTAGDDHEHAAGILSWVQALTAFLEDLDGRFRASTLPEHRFARAWTPTCVLEGLGFDGPVYRLPLARQALLRIEERLARIGFCLVLLRVPHRRVQAQCVESTRAHRGPKWAKYLSSFGPDDPSRAACAERAQDRLMQWTAASPLPLRVIDTESADWDAYAGEVSDLIMSGA